MSKQKLGFWYWVFWVAVIAMVVWVIAKLLGIIQTPLIFEIFPVTASIIALIGIGIALGNNFQKTNFAIEKIKKIETRQDKMAYGLINIEKDISIIKKDINQIKEKL